MSGNGTRRTWGWHPLTDRWAELVVEEAEVRPGELVLDLGAGTGALTRHLVQSGARVVAVELHPRRVQFLREQFARDSVTVVHADLTTMPLPRRPFRVVASPPYGVTTALVRRLLARESRLVAADLVLQRGAARRLAERAPNGSARWTRTWSLDAGRGLPRRAFRPPPTVDSAVLRVRRHGR